MNTESPNETTRPSTAEIDSVWLTRGSVKPIWLAGALLATLAGLFSFWPLLVAGAVASVLIAWSWAAEARAESGDLPRV